MKLRPTTWIKIREEIIKRDNSRCLRCGEERKKKRKVDGQVIFEDNLRVDHLLPMTLGGTSLSDNLQTLCLRCNSQKNSWDQSLIAKRKRIFKTEEVKE